MRETINEIMNNEKKQKFWICFKQENFSEENLEKFGNKTTSEFRSEVIKNFSMIETETHRESISTVMKKYGVDKDKLTALLEKYSKIIEE